MPTKLWTVAFALLVGSITGCSVSSISDIASSVGGGELVATVPTLENGPVGDQPQRAADGPDETEEFVPPFPESIDLFSPPKVVVPVVAKEPELTEDAVHETFEEQPSAPPALRLLGFVEVEGLKALLTVEGQLQVVTIGDSVSGVEIIAVEAPNVTLKHGGQEFQLNLFEQEWFHSTHDTSAVFDQQRTFGDSPVRSFVETGRGARQLPVLPRTRDDDTVNTRSELPGLQGRAILGLPGVGDLISPPELPELPRLDEDQHGGLPSLPALGENGT